MAESIHPAASHNLPSFITAPGETDVLMVVMGIILVLAILLFGVFFFHLHTLPERIAHKTHKVQLEIVAVLGLISLFTHMHIFWIAGLILAFIDLPDFGGSLNRIAHSAEKIAGVEPGSPADEPTVAGNQHADEHANEKAQAPVEARMGRKGEGVATLAAPVKQAKGG
jgi:hypothetical protein